MEIFAAIGFLVVIGVVIYAHKKHLSAIAEVKAIVSRIDASHSKTEAK